MDNDKKLEKKNIRYKKLENSVSSDPNRMYVNSISDSEIEDKYHMDSNLKHLKKTDGFMKDLYNLFIGNKHVMHEVIDETNSLNVNVDLEYEEGYVSVILKSNTVESDIIENYLDNSSIIQ